MDFSQIIPRELHPALRWLGRQGQWLKLSTDPSKCPTIIQSEYYTSFDISERLETAKDENRYLPLLKKCNLVTKSHGVLRLCVIDAIAKCLADGPKIFCPTDEQYESMQHVELNIPISDYQQPYPAVVVKLPDRARKQLFQETGCQGNNPPSWAIIRQGKTQEDKTYVTTFHSFGAHEHFQFFQDRPAFPDIESAITKRNIKEGETSAEYEFSEISARACLNLMLMLMHYGYELGKPLDPKAYHKHRSKKKLEHLKHGDFLTINMKQDIIVRRVKYGGHNEEPIPTGREMPPHWVRGHWKNQHYGAGNLKVKRMLIKPYMVRRDRMIGDIGDSETRYYPT